MSNSGDHTAEKLGRLPFAGIALALLVMATLWFRNINRIDAGHALPTFAFVIAAAVAVTLLLRLAMGGWARAGLASGLFAAWLFYASPIARIIAHGWTTELILLIIFGALAIWALRKIPAESKARLVNGKINLILLPLSLAIAANTAFSAWKLERARPDLAAQFAPFDGKAAPDSPDVWHILFDRYASAETLRDRYAFDNQPFVAELRKRGFTVGTEQYSNYQRTAHSVAATMNGADLDRLAGGMQPSQSDWVPIYRAISDNQATRFFRAQGYKPILAGTWWTPTVALEGAETVNHRPLPELGRLVIAQSAAGTALSWLGMPYGDPRAEQCHRENRKFAELARIARDPSRKYVFAHFLVPHPPFVLNADGSCRSARQALRASRRDNYVGQIEYANRQALALVDAILAGPRPAAIVIHSDEGPWPEPHVGDEHRIGQDLVAVDWVKMDQARLREKMGILMAVRSPNGPPATMPETPVAIYPALLRDHFANRRPLPPTRHRVFLSDDALYRFHDVATKLKGPAAQPLGR